MPHAQSWAGARGPADQGPDWLARLDAASGERELLVVVKDYVASWSPLELSRLPWDAHPGPLKGAADVSEYAVRVTQARLNFMGSVTDGLLLDRMMSFMTHAAMRLAQAASLFRAGIEVRY